MTTLLILTWIIQLIFVPLASPLCIGVIRKIKARLQNRQGAGIFQPYFDIWKLLHKDEVISKDASWIFRFAPYIIFTSTIVVGLATPLFATFINNNFTGDILVIVCTLSIGTFFLALAGMDTGGGFGGFGSSREMTMAALSEGGFIFSLLTMAIITNTTNLFTIAQNASLLPGQFFLSITLAFLGFFMVMLAETSRFPFDNPATHLELTMIHEAMILEYSGKKLALIEWASANKLLIFIALASNLFFPFGIAQSATASALFFGIIIFSIKIIIFCATIAILESSIAKLRFFRLPDLLLISFIFNIIAIILIK